MAFASRVRTGEFGKGNQVHHRSVDSALREVAQALVLLGLGDPRKAGGASQQQLNRPLHQLLQRYRNKDPPSELQLAVPIDV
eukprot:10843746-Ditylum_brightwellii.AAC.1